MAKRDGFKRYLDAGSAFTQITRARAEELVQELVKSGDIQRKEARSKADELIERSRKSSEAFITQVRDEVANQMHALGIHSIEDLARQVASLLGRSTAEEAPTGASATAKKAAKKASATKKAVKKAPAAKKAAKKAPAAKKAVKKAPGAKKATKKAPAAKKAVKKAPAAKKAPAPVSGSPD